MRVVFVSLGCDKNTVDSEMMLGLLADAGHELVYDDSEADAVVINTCAFILDAKEESINRILSYARLKNEGRIRHIIVAGCLAQRYSDDICREIPEVDAVIGTQSFDRVAEVLNDLASEDGTSKDVGESDRPEQILDDLSLPPVCGLRRLLTTAPHYAYIKIAEGCNKACTYCIIPTLRGRYRSVPMEVLIKEAEGLARNGVKELILVAQETTLYGIDLYGKKRLPELVKSLSAIEDISHIRLLYCYPEEITDELIDLMASEPKLCHYIDMPIQHASDAILKRMGRRTDEQSIRKLIADLRKRIPDICIRTTLITGFPGENAKDYGILKRFVKDMHFDRLGVFTFSPEEGTVAAGMPHKVLPFVARMRRDSIMRLQQSIVFEANRRMTGREMTVTIQGRLPEERVYVARSYMDAPDVDGMIFVDEDRELISGEDVRVCITGARGYDLTARIIQEDSDSL